MTNKVDKRGETSTVDFVLLLIIAYLLMVLLGGWAIASCSFLVTMILMGFIILIGEKGFPMDTYRAPSSKLTSVPQASKPEDATPPTPPPPAERDDRAA